MQINAKCKRGESQLEELFLHNIDLNNATITNATSERMANDILLTFTVITSDGREVDFRLVQGD